MSMIQYDGIQTLQFKRGDKQVLEARLSGVAKPLAGEPVFEQDTGKLKIGDGLKDYIELPYIAGNGDDSRFIIQDPVSNQVLLYDATIDKWVNKDLADAKSIIYLQNNGLTIKGYDSATQGQMLVKDSTNGLAWIDPISQQELDQKVQAAAISATVAATEASKAGNSAVQADTAAQIASEINSQTVDYVENKFWWGTMVEYNQLPKIEADTFYFIMPGN